MTPGYPALALGPLDRFADLGGEQGWVSHRQRLQGVTLAQLQAMVDPDPHWHVVQDRFEPARQHRMETVFTADNGFFAS